MSLFENQRQSLERTQGFSASDTLQRGTLLNIQESNHRSSFQEFHESLSHNNSGHNTLHGQSRSSHLKLNDSKTQLIRNLTQDLELKQMEISQLKEILQNSQLNCDEQKNQNKEQLYQERIEKQKLRDLQYQQDLEKEEIFKQYDEQMEDCRKQLEEEADIKSQLQHQSEELNKEIEFLKQQLMDREAFQQNKSDMNQGSKQYFETIVFQNNHMQLEVKKLADQFKEFMNGGGCNGLKINNKRKELQLNEERFYVDQNQLRQMSKLITKLDKNTYLGQIVNEKFDSKLERLINEQEYGQILMSSMKIIAKLAKGLDDQVQTQGYNSQESATKNKILNETKLDDQYSYYMNLLQDSSEKPRKLNLRPRQYVETPNFENDQTLRRPSMIKSAEKKANLSNSKTKRYNKHCLDCYDYMLPKDVSQSPNQSQNRMGSSQKKKKVTYQSDFEEQSQNENRPLKPNININNKVVNSNLQVQMSKAMKNKQNSINNRPSQTNSVKQSFIQIEENQSDTFSREIQKSSSRNKSNSRSNTIDQDQIKHTQSSIRKSRQSPINNNSNAINNKQITHSTIGNNDSLVRQAIPQKRSPSQKEMKSNISPNKMYKIDMENLMFKEYNPLLTKSNISQSSISNISHLKQSSISRKSQNNDFSPMRYSEFEGKNDNTMKPVYTQQQQQRIQISNNKTSSMKNRYLQRNAFNK